MTASVKTIEDLLEECARGVAEAALACERLLASVRNYPWGDLAVGLTCTVSAGLAQLAPAEGVLDWFARADAALYTAKRRGRDQVSTDSE